MMANWSNSMASCTKGFGKGTIERIKITEYDTWHVHRLLTLRTGQFALMWLHRSNYHRLSLPLLCKCGGIGFLFFLTWIVMACGGPTSQNGPGTPAATLTIVFGQARTSPVPSLLPYYCGGWATDATKPYAANGVVNVYGKFTQTDTNQNPVGVEGATATATILWPDQSTQTITATTTSDGLATFSIPLKASAINHLVLIQITFVKGNVTCHIQQAAFFTAILASATPTPCHRRKCRTPTP